jgi:hypothetical protein
MVSSSVGSGLIFLLEILISAILRFRLSLKRDDLWTDINQYLTIKLMRDLGGSPLTFGHFWVSDYPKFILRSLHLIYFYPGWILDLEGGVLLYFLDGECKSTTQNVCAIMIL